MKIINKISRFFLLSSSVIIIIVGILLYVIIEQIITSEIDEQLLNVCQRTVNELKKGNESNFPPMIEVKEIQGKISENSFNNVFLKSYDDDGEEPYRQYISYNEINGKQFEIIVRISLIEKEDMLLTIFGITVAAICLLLLIMFFITKKSSLRILKDFYNTLNKLENFSLTQNNALNLNKSNIEEFDKLNKAVHTLSVKAIDDYRSLKEFTEETNHEMQTPVAVIKSKLELLLQSENLRQYDMDLLHSALNNINKLERVNKALLLLNKLDHRNLFKDSEVNLAIGIKNIIESYSDSIASKHISFSDSLNENVIITINPALLNILLNNLISNSIRYNILDGEIYIELDSSRLSIHNSTITRNDNIDKFFKRFYKDSRSDDSVGLGLTIVKKICDLYEIDIVSDINDRLYSIKLNFNKILSNK